MRPALFCAALLAAAAAAPLAPAPAHADGHDEANQFDLAINGYLRTVLGFVHDDATQTDFVGRNDGFKVGNARLIVSGSYRDLHFELGLDGAVDRRDGSNTATGEVKVSLKDAFVRYAPWSWLHLTVGQFKPPFDAEELTSTRSMLFIDRAVESRGVLGVEGRNVAGLSLDRQVGVMLSSDDLMLASVPLGLRYYVAVTDGTDANHPLNDNDSFAYTGRLEFLWSDHLVVGVGAHHNAQTLGEAPDLLNQTRFGLAADLSLDIAGVLLRGQFMRFTTTVDDVEGEPEITAMGYHAQIGYELPWGFVPAYRFASYDPTSDFDAGDPAVASQFDADALMYHTVGLAWFAPGYPARLAFNYTLTVEEDARELNNDRVDFLVQVEF